MTVLGTEPAGMREIENPNNKVPCPTCRSHDLAECDHGLPIGLDHEAAMPRTSAINEEYSLDRHRLYLLPEKHNVSWLTKIRCFALSLWEGPKKSLRIVLQHERPSV